MKMADLLMDLCVICYVPPPALKRRYKRYFFTGLRTPLWSCSPEKAWVFGSEDAAKARLLSGGEEMAQCCFVTKVAALIGKEEVRK